MAPLGRLERLFQVSLGCLAGCALLALLSSASIDPVTSVAVIAALVYRFAGAFGVRLWRPTRGIATVAVVLALAAAAVDFVWGGQDLFAASLRLLLWLSAIQLVAARTGRDCFYLGMLAFLQVLAASLFLVGVSYLFLLAAFLLLTVMTYSAYEIRRGAETAARTVFGPRTTAVGGVLAVVGVTVSVGILVLSAGLFFIIPRAQGSSQLALQTDYSVGFANQVDLGLTGALAVNPAPVMYVEPLDGASLADLRWRGLRLYVFDGVRWSAPQEPDARTLRSRERGFMRGPERRLGEGRRIRYRVSLEPLPTDALFVTGEAEQVRASFPVLTETREGILRVPDYSGQGLRYEATSWLVDRDLVRPNDVIELFSDQFQGKYLRLPEIDPRISALAEKVTAGASSPLERARMIEQYLETEFTYTLQLPARRAPDPLAHFLFERGEGHCEYFASAMGVMLRTLGIPSRLVGGFAGGVHNPLTGKRVLRSSDAHSWVEAYIPGYGWLEFDPSPQRPGAGGLFSDLWIYWDAVRVGWMDWVVDYDATRQVELARAVQEGSRSTIFNAALAWEDFEDRARRLLASMSARTSTTGALPHWTPLLGVALAIVAVVVAAPRLRRYWRRRRLARGRGSMDDRRRLFEQALQLLEKRGFPRREDETAEELAARLPPGDLSNAYAALAAAYNAARFGGDRQAESRLPALLQRLLAV